MRGEFMNRGRRNYLSTIMKYKKRLFYYLSSILVLFFIISILTSIKPSYRISSQFIADMTKEIDSSTFLYIMGAESNIFKKALPEDKKFNKLSNVMFHVVTNVKPDDIRSLLGQELPGLFPKTNMFIVKGSETDYTNFSFESSPPVKQILEEREAIYDEEKEVQEEKEIIHTTGDRKVVFIYNSHNRESFLPHLPEVTDPNLAHHRKVNITKVSDYLAKSLEQRGIGTEVDKTDHMQVLDKNNWTYGQSYRASREVIQEVLSTNKDVQYMFDLHRDALPRDRTTITIDDQSYGQILIVIGEEHESYETNLSLAREIHQRIEEEYPGLSKGVLTKKGPGNNGIYNQDMLDTALLFEIGGYGNTLEELFRTADVLADIFSEYYWQAEKVFLEE